MGDRCIESGQNLFARIRALVCLYMGQQEKCWQDSVGVLRRLVILSDKMRSGASSVTCIGKDMLYVAGNIGMAIAVETRQHDFVWDWMLLPMPGFRQGEEMPWAEIREAFCRFEIKDPFRFLLNLYRSEHVRSFFQSEERMKEFLFKSNLLQSIIELRLLTRTNRGVEILEKRFDKFCIKVLPLWCLISADDFSTWALDLFGSKEGFITFFMMDNGVHIETEMIWSCWKSWKKMCADLTFHITQDRAWVHSEWLILPGEP
jgi:hypothetical protein